MKKVTLLLVSVFCLGLFSANAQHLIIKAGYNYSNVSTNYSGASIGTAMAYVQEGKSGWQLGVGYQTGSSMGFSFQPELIYKVTGYKFSDIKNMNLGYLEVPLNVQWGPNLLVARPFVFAGPYVGLKVSNQFRGSDWNDTDMEQIRDGLRAAEWGLGTGVGLNIFKLQLTAKYNWNFGSIADTDKLPTLDSSPRTFEISLGLRF